MKSIKNILLIFFVSIVFIILFSNNSYAMDQNLNNLEFNIKIMENGDVWISEIWDIELDDTNTLFKTFTKNSKFRVISDVSVTEQDSSGNTIKNFQNSNEYKYHEDKDYFHAIDDENGNFEIAWGVSANGEEHRYFKISYMIENCINVYNDCAEFYWQVIGDEWEIKTDRISGTVTLPNEVLEFDDFRVWAHGPLHGEIHKEDNKTCNFNIINMPTNTFLELRLVFPKEVVNKVEETHQTENIDKLDTILIEEQRNADKANWQREKSKRTSNITFIVGLIISILFEFFSVKKLMNLIKEYNTLNIFKGKFNFPYYREIPNEKLDPVEATILSINKISDNNMIFSLFMSLAYKKAIKIKPGDKKDNTEIEVNLNNENNSNLESLSEGERYLGGYLEKIGKSFSIKQFEKYINNHAESFYNLIKKISSCSNSNLKSNFKYINRDAEDYKKRLSTRAYICLLNIFIYLSIILAFLIGISNTVKNIFVAILGIVVITYIGSSLCLFCLRKKVNIYTEEGTEERAKWRGLKKFMEDFSLIDEREIPELALWEQYLVYATGFGIANKVLKQLKTRFPEINNSDNYYNNYSCFYIANNNMFSNSMNKSVSKAISVHNAQVAASSYSSGSGGGGGFSSGGGGGRRRRPVAAEDKILKNKKPYNDI